MADGVWFSQLFENSYDGGVLVALPYEALADWPGAGDAYDEVVDEVGQFLCRPVGKSVGLFVSEDEGIHEAHWMRFDDQFGVILVVWIAWDDPSRPTLPEDMKQVALAWQRGDDPRQAWIAERLRLGDLVWQQQELVQSIPGGVLLLLHAEDRPLKARFAKPRPSRNVAGSSRSAFRPATTAWRRLRSANFRMGRTCVLCAAGPR